MLATTFDPSNPATWVGAGGVGITVGAMTVAFLKEWVVPGPSHRRLIEVLQTDIARKDEQIAGKDARLEELGRVKDQKIDGLHDLIEGRTLEALTKAATVMGDTLDLLRARRLRTEMDEERRS
jgi:hypothetical protein